MIKPRVHYDTFLEVWICEVLFQESYDETEWEKLPVGYGSTNEEAFTDWYIKQFASDLIANQIENDLSGVTAEDL